MGKVIPIQAAPSPTLDHASEAYLTAHQAPGAWSEGTMVKYRQTLTGLGKSLKDTPVAHTLSALDTDEGAKRLGVAFAEAFGSLAPATRLRHLSTLRSAIAWWQVNGWLKTDPTTGWPMPKVTVDTTRALSHHNVASLWRLDVGLREKTFWKMLYESAARADEILSLNIEDLDLPNKQARVVGKGGNIQWIHWQSGTAHLLPRLIAGRTRGPVFLADRLPTKPVASLDLCPTTGRARLSYRRAAEIFELATRPLAHPAASAEELADLDGWTLHQLRHAALTHDAEDGTNTPTLLARSRHRSIRSLERYTRVGRDALAKHVADRDPNARKNKRG
jgi:integrase/recombinase XerD